MNEKYSIEFNFIIKVLYRKYELILIFKVLKKF